MRVPQSHLSGPEGAPRWFAPVVVALGVLGVVAGLGLRSSQRTLVEEAQPPRLEAQEWTVEVERGMDLTQRVPARALSTRALSTPALPTQVMAPAQQSANEGNEASGRNS